LPVAVAFPPGDGSCLEVCAASSAGSPEFVSLSEGQKRFDKEFATTYGKEAESIWLNRTAVFRRSDVMRCF